MQKPNVLLGMGIGVTVGSIAVATMTTGKKTSKNIIGKTLKTMCDVVDAVSSSIGI